MRIRSAAQLSSVAFISSPRRIVGGRAISEGVSGNPRNPPKTAPVKCLVIGLVLAI